MCNDIHSIAQTVYPRLAAWFDAVGIRLGFEAEGGGCRENNRLCGALFRVEPGFSVTGGYVNGTALCRGSFTICLRCGDADRAARMSAQTLLARLAEDIRRTDWRQSLGAMHLDTVMPSTVPARLRLLPGGEAVWELRLQFSSRLHPATADEGAGAMRISFEGNGKETGA